MYWSEYKTKNEKYATNEYRYFIESKFVGVNRLIVFVYSIQNDNSKRYEAKTYCLTKDVINLLILIQYNTKK